MAAFLLNLSVDAPDPFPRHVAEDLSHNDQESIVEWVVETLLGYEAAFAEFDDDDSDERSINLTLELNATLLPVPAFGSVPPPARERSADFPPYLRWGAPGHRDIDAPPPRV